MTKAETALNRLREAAAASPIALDERRRWIGLAQDAKATINDAIRYADAELIRMKSNDPQFDVINENRRELEKARSKIDRDLILFVAERGDEVLAPINSQLGLLVSDARIASEELLRTGQATQQLLEYLGIALSIAAVILAFL